MTKLFSTVDVARRLGVAEHRIRYAIRSGQLAEPRWLVAGKSIFSDRDVRRIAEHFNVPIDREKKSYE